MKTSNRILSLMTILVFTLMPALLYAQAAASGAGETLWTTGKINVVIIIAAVIFSGIALFLILLERKISGLEKKVTNKN